MKKTLFALLGIAIIFAAIYSQRAALSINLMERVAAKRLASDTLASLPDGLHVILCGAGGPLPDPKRSGPCVTVIAGNTIVIVDAGSGGVRNLQAMQIPVGKIDTVFLTHFHSDHIDGLGEMAMMRWVNAANTTALPVIGPTGVKAVVDGFNLAYATDATYRHKHHSDLVAPLSGRGMTAIEITPPTNNEHTTVFDKNGLVVSLFNVEHQPVSPAVGYRFDYKGRSIVISGDTAKSAKVQAMAAGVDVLVHEALAPHFVGILNNAAKQTGNAILEKITFDIPDYHTSPVEVAHIAEAADVDYLLYYHVVPALVAPGMEAAFLQGVSEIYSGPLAVGVDGSMVSLPANSDIIKTAQKL